MPLADLIRHFNREAEQREGAAVCHGYLQTAAEGAIAIVDGLQLGSRFAPIVELGKGMVIAHQALSHVSTEEGAADPYASLFAALRQPAEVVALDRLIRTLHSLNFLAQRQATGGFLFLDVHPRHLEGVAANHGLVFEAILKRCGLAPEDLVLQVDSTQAGLRPQVQAALQNYRRRGYGVALTWNAPGAPIASFAVDFLKADANLPTEQLTALRQNARNSGTTFILSGVDRGERLELARQLGADLVQGRALGQSSTHCRPTHQSGKARAHQQRTTN